jgi:hypothetical protein
MPGVCQVFPFLSPNKCQTDRFQTDVAEEVTELGAELAEATLADDDDCTDENDDGLLQRNKRKVEKLVGENKVVF